MKEISTPLLFRKSFLNLNLASSGRIVGEKRNKKNRCKNIFLRYLNLRYEINSTFLNIHCFYKSF